MSSTTPSSSRKSKGRQKVEMKKMTNESNLQVTFSKRRSGLFKKASELCTLCGAEVALVVFSPGDKAFSFGHPNVDAVVDRYLTRGPLPPPPQSSSATMHLIEAHRNANVRELISQFTQISAHLDHEKKRGDELNRMRRATQGQCWWAAPIDEMTNAQLEQFKIALEELKKIVTRQADRMILIQSANNNSTQFSLGASSSNIAQPAPAPTPPVMFQPPSVFQNHGFDGNMMHPPQHHHGFNNNNNMRGYGGPGFY